jgi:hypothetical protein
MSLDPANANTYADGSVVGTLNGLYKEQYADKVKQLVPDHTKMVQSVPFSKSEKLGANYNEPVILGLEGGITYGGSEGNAFALNDIISFPMKNASIKGHEMVLRSGISIGAISRSMSSGAIERAMDLLLGNMLKSMYHRLEIQLIHGQSGIGSVSENIKDDAAEGTQFPIAGTTIYLTKDQWAAGIWNGTTKSKIEFVDSAVSQSHGEATITGYSLKDRSITVDALPTLNGGPAIDDKIFFKGAVEAGVTPLYKEFKGLESIAQETVELFGIPNANEPLFQGNIVAVGDEVTGDPAVLSFEKIEDGIASMVEKGLGEEEVSCYVNPKSWKNLMTEQDAKRVFDSSYKKEAEAGHSALKFYGQNGTIKIVSSTFVKEGQAFLCVDKELRRVGSSDVDFKLPGRSDEYFKLMENANGVEIRCYTDQALFTARPSSITVLTLIKS